MNFATFNASWSYAKNSIISNANCEIDTSRITAIIGPNGCGKSTFLRGLTGLLKPSSGHVEFKGKDLKKWPARLFAREVAVLAQSPSAPEGLTVRQLIEHGRFPHQGVFGQMQKDDLDAIQWALEITNLVHFKDRIFNTLSGGERQRAWIALALTQKTKILFLDEPTTFLDIGHQLKIMELLVSLNTEHKIGIVTVLHDINHASCFADQIIAMKDGEIISQGNTGDVINSELIKNLFDIKANLTEVTYKQHEYLHYIPVSSI